jgi:hypothetical protein
MRVELKVGQTVQIGGASVTLEEKSGQRARLRVEAPASVPLDRSAAAPPQILGVNQRQPKTMR